MWARGLGYETLCIRPERRGSANLPCVLSTLLHNPRMQVSLCIGSDESSEFGTTERGGIARRLAGAASGKTHAYAARVST